MKEQNETDKMPRNRAGDENIARLQRLIRAAAAPADLLYYQLGNAYRKRGDFAEALNCYLEALSINPDSPAAEAYRMLVGIMEYYHKDYYNP